MRRATTQALIKSVGEPTATEGFEHLAWLFTCDSRNRGLIRQGFDEAALLWKAVKSTSGDVLEIGRNLAGSTVLLATAAGQFREIYSIDNRSNEDRECKNYLTNLSNSGRVHLLVADSRKPLSNLRFGLVFIDGDHTFEGVLADVCAHWNSAEPSDGKAALVAFHDALPNDNFKWRDADRRLNRLWTRLKNKFRKRQKSEIAPGYAPGVLRVCEELIRQGLAIKWGSAASMREILDQRMRVQDPVETDAAWLRKFSGASVDIEQLSGANHSRLIRIIVQREARIAFEHDQPIETHRSRCNDHRRPSNPNRDCFGYDLGRSGILSCVKSRGTRIRCGKCDGGMFLAPRKARANG